MSVMKACGAGCVVGLIGAAVWAGVGHFLNLEASLIAIGIGWAVGFVIGLVAADEASVVTGAAAVLITVLSIVGGKWAYIEMGVSEALGEVDVALDFDREDVLAKYATDIADEREADGQRLNWPPGMSNDEAWEEDEFPADVWGEAVARWDTLDADEQQAELDTYNDAGAFVADVKWEAFKDSFGLFDLLFFGIAVVIAFPTGAGMRND